MWCAAGAVNTVIDDSRLTFLVDLLSTMGCLFSVAWRWLGIDKRYINFAFLIGGMWFLCSFLSGRFDLGYFLPSDFQQPDMNVAVGLLWLNVLRSWILVTDGAALFTLVTSLAAAGLTGAFNINPDFVYIFVIMISVSLYMLMTSNFSSFFVSSRSHVAYVQMTHVVLSVLIGLSSILIGFVVGMPLAAAGANISIDKALQGFISKNLSSITARTNTVSFSDDRTMTIGDGGGYSNDSTILLMVKSSDLEPYYLRGRTYNHYTIAGWQSTLDQPMTNLPPYRIFKDTGTSNIKAYRLLSYPSEEAQGASFKLSSFKPVLLNVSMEGGRTNTVYLPDHAHSIAFHNSQQNILSETPDGHLGIDYLQDHFSYQVDALKSTSNISNLTHSMNSKIPSFIIDNYVNDLGQPDISNSDQERLRSTALSIIQSIPKENRSIYNEAEAIRSWISTHCAYSLAVAPVPRGADPVSFFLFDSKQGYCDLFSSSMVMLCRYAGIPARLVTGFAPGEQGSQGDFTIRVKDKHAWSEVYIPDYGWIEFDPTIGSADAPKQAGSSSLRNYFHGVYLAFLRFIDINGPVPIFLFITILLCLAYVVKVEIIDRLVRRRRVRSKRRESLKFASSESAEELMKARWEAHERLRRAEDILMSMGFPIRDSETPLSYVRLLKEKAPSIYRGAKFAPADLLVDALETIYTDASIASYAPDSEAQSLLDDDHRNRIALVSRQISIASRAHFWGRILRMKPA
jgi:hypothetical protein